MKIESITNEQIRRCIRLYQDWIDKDGYNSHAVDYIQENWYRE